MRLYRALLLTATLLALGVISLGAYVRLSDAGLGCPDWPGCYGHLLGVPDTAHEHSLAQQAFPDSPVETHKAWKEMTHRYFAGTLGLLIVAIAVLAWGQRRTPGESNQSPWIATGLIGIVGLQALLGMWTVTLLLRPVVVTAHLLGGMTTLALLVWLLLSSGRTVKAEGRGRTGSLRFHAMLALLAVVAQIALGGWVSSNYAALICNDFPTCLGTWVPEMDFAAAFSLHRELGRMGTGDFLPGTALVAIQWSHRIGALVVAAIAGTLAWRLWRSTARRPWGIWLGLSLTAQIALGIANVLLFLPLHLAVAHNLGAAVLLAVVLALNIALATGEADGIPASNTPAPARPAAGTRGNGR